MLQEQQGRNEWRLYNATQQGPRVLRLAMCKNGLEAYSENESSPISEAQKQYHIMSLLLSLSPLPTQRKNRRQENAGLKQ